jgi:glucosamine--fructose-6-phosphate aminotransferase (isomerizing)
VPAQAFLASEYATAPAPISEGTLVVGVTQSGETADTLAALRRARRRGVETLAMTNVVGSTAARECDRTLLIRAGPEIGVAATKTFSSQVVACNLLSATLAERGDAREVVEALRDLPGQVQEILDASRAEAVADRFVDSDGYFFIGRGHHHPVALEGALKMKEITYKHAEGFPAGELKHGPLALVTAETPVFAIVTGNDDKATKTVGNVKEVEARDAPVVAVTDDASEVERYADAVLELPETHPRVAPVLANVQLQLVAYHVANELGRSIDKPRNLAKSVTVE